MASDIAMNGWDIIAATTQDAINKQLLGMPEIKVNRQIKFELFHMPMTVDVDVSLGRPQIETDNVGSGRTIKVALALSGSIKMNGDPIKIDNGQKVIVKTDLARIEAKLNATQSANETDYQLIINFKEDIPVEMKSELPAQELAFLLKTLEQIVYKDLAHGHQYPVVRFSLSNEQAQQYQLFIPRLADFSFVENTSNRGRSNFLVLLQTVSKDPGGIFFNKPLLADDQTYAAFMSNKLFMEYYILPPLLSKVKDMAKDKDDAGRKIAMRSHADTHGTELFEVSNEGAIGLDKDHEPWIEKIRGYIDTDRQALSFYLNVQCNATFLDIHKTMTDQSWQQFDVAGSDTKISLKQIDEQKSKETSMEWWKWLLSALGGPIWLIINGVTYGLVENDSTNLGGTFSGVGSSIVQWPGQKVVQLQKITSPSHIVFTLDVQF